jgi:hypothetical protein
MFAAGKPVWYLPFAILAIAFFLFTIVGLGYDRYIFVNNHEPYPDSLTAILSKDTIVALKEDARLHHAILGLTESIARTSSEIGQRYGFEGVKSFGTNLTESITELRKRHDVKGRKRGLIDDTSQAMKDVLSGLGVNVTGGVSSIVGNLGNALIDGLATPALFLGIGVGYVDHESSSI